MSTDQRENLYILAFSLVVVMLSFGIVIPIMPFCGKDGNRRDGAWSVGHQLRGDATDLRSSMGHSIGPGGPQTNADGGRLWLRHTMIQFGLATELWMLFLFRILSSATYPTTMAYIGDSTPEKERSQGMGILGTAVGVGTIVGPGLGGLLAGENLATPFFIAGEMSFFTLLSTWLFLPESLKVAASQGNVAGSFQLYRQPAADGFPGFVWPDGFLRYLWALCSAKVQHGSRNGWGHHDGFWPGNCAGSRFACRAVLLQYSFLLGSFQPLWDGKRFMRGLFDGLAVGAFALAIYSLARSLRRAESLSRSIQVKYGNIYCKHAWQDKIISQDYPSAPVARYINRAADADRRPTAGTHGLFPQPADPVCNDCSSARIGDAGISVLRGQAAQWQVLLAGRGALS